MVARTMRRWVLILAMATLGVSQAQQVELLNDESGGEVEITRENRFEIIDLQGTFSLRLGKPGELRYMARDAETRREEIPVALWLDGSSLGLSPLVVLVFLFLWGWLWGIPGMILAVPVAAIIKIICANIPDLHIIAALMSNE